MESDHQTSSKMLHDWLIDVKKDLGEGRLDGDVGGSVRMPPICRVPVKVRDMNEKAYQPEVVSIGPYHYGEARFQAMEKHKRRALLHFLSRSKRTPEACLGLLNESLAEIMVAYDNLHKKWEDDDGELFLKVMLMDGCFILEILLTSAGVVKDYAEDDPIFGRQGQLYTVPSIRRDLLLIENQIPLLVLRELFVFSGAKIEVYDDIDDLFGLLLEFLPECSLVDIPDGHRWRLYWDELQPSLHILDLYRRRMIVVREEKSDYNLMKFSPKIQSAMALQDHGILLRKVRVPVIWFSRRRMPWKGFPGRKLNLLRLTVDDTTESVFLNAMVFESLQRPTADARFTSYVSLMCNLIVSPKDANLLSTELGIIRNGLRSDQALVDLFSNLSSANFLPDHRLFKIQETINEYCGKRRNRFRAYVNRTYFRNPWVIPVFYAIIILVLTAIQAFYTIFPNITNNHR